MTINIALIGLGKMGKNHARVLSGLPNVYFSAICDTDPTLEIEVRNYNVRFYTDYEKMIKEENPDAVNIVVPAMYHPDILRGCIGLDRKYIFVEKPAVPIKRIEEGREILQTAYENDSVIMAGDITCYDPATQTLMENLDKLGRTYKIHCARFSPNYPYRITDVGVDEDSNIHDVAFARYVTGWQKFRLMTSIQASIYRKDQMDFCTNEYESIDKTKERITFITSASWLAGKKVRTAIVHGEKAIAQLNFIDKERSVKLLPSEIIKDVGMNLPVKNEEPLKNELEHFVNCIEYKKMPLTSLERHLGNLEMLLPKDFVNFTKK